MRQPFRKSIFLSVLLAALLLSGCAPDWEISLTSSAGLDTILTYQTWKSADRFAGEGGIPLEQILYGEQVELIDRIVLTTQEGKTQAVVWDQAAWGTRLTEKGTLSLGEEEFTQVEMEVIISPWAEWVQAGIVDIAPTAAAALDLPVPELAEGSPLAVERADRVLLLFLDGFGYLRYQEALEAGLIPVLGSLEPPLVGVTTYPPITSVSTASLLTGAPPPVHGVETRGIRTTEQETLLEIASREGLQVSAVEGEALAFNLKGAELQLSGDRDGDGGTDDNVLANTLAVLQEGVPDLFYVHFHGIDDLGHHVGPAAPEEEEIIREIDQAVGVILAEMPPGTLVIIFADHGMHLESGGERQGNHGHLIPRDMLIPIWVEYLD